MKIVRHSQALTAKTDNLSGLMQPIIDYLPGADRRVFVHGIYRRKSPDLDVDMAGRR
jgi:hypothetical protein